MKEFVFFENLIADIYAGPFCVDLSYEVGQLVLVNERRHASIRTMATHLTYQPSTGSWYRQPHNNLYAPENLGIDTILFRKSLLSKCVSENVNFKSLDREQRALILNAIKSSPYAGQMDISGCKLTDALKTELVDLLRHKSGSPLEIMNASFELTEIMDIVNEPKKIIALQAELAALKAENAVLKAENMRHQELDEVAEFELVETDESKNARLVSPLSFLRSNHGGYDERKEDIANSPSPTLP